MCVEHSPIVNPGMVWVEGSRFWMGSDKHYPEEAPAREICVEGFLIDVGPVTNSQFSQFVETTGYQTTAEQTPSGGMYETIDSKLLVPGSMVFRGPMVNSLRSDWQHWWHYVPGASWKTGSCHRASEPDWPLHPVVHVSYIDAKAYATWADKELPTEEEWELAAWGGFSRREFPWGDKLTVNGRHMANTWQGNFPFDNDRLDGWAFTSPVGHYPANDFGIHDMIGNVWEWTESEWATGLKGSMCCGDSAGEALVSKVIKGGSHLCAPNYCRRYRPSARQPQATDTSTSHIGFRCIKRVPGQK